MDTLGGQFVSQSSSGAHPALLPLDHLFAECPVVDEAQLGEPVENLVGGLLRNTPALHRGFKLGAGTRPQSQLPQRDLARNRYRISRRLFAKKALRLFPPRSSHCFRTPPRR